MDELTKITITYDPVSGVQVAFTGKHDPVALLGMLEWARQAVLREVIKPVLGEMKEAI